MSSIIEIVRDNSIRFGTDGWRAVIGDGFTFANLERVAQAYADFVNQARGDQCSCRSSVETFRRGKAPLVVVGFDCRFLSPEFAKRTAEILNGNEISVALFDNAIPTPIVSWTVREKKAAGGIVITASHNPAEFNGFKIKTSFGGSATSEITQAVEALIDNRPPLIKSVSAAANSETLESGIRTYREQIASFIDLELICAARQTVVIDSMHGSGAGWIESFLRAEKLKTEIIRARRDPLFGGVNPEPVDRNLKLLKKSVGDAGALIGLATDGDADRLGAVNEKGETMTMHQVVPLLLLHLIRRRKMSGAIVKTFSQSVLVERIAAAHNLPLYETPIGFKYIAELMLREDILIGAEESGGIGIKGHLPERDGILNNLLLLEAVIAAAKTPSELVRDIYREFGEFYFDRLDISMNVGRGQEFVKNLALNPPDKIAEEKVIEVKTLDGTKLLFGDESWLLFRQSGTEPILRVYCEATAIVKTAKLLKAGIQLANREA